MKKLSSALLALLLVCTGTAQAATNYSFGAVIDNATFTRGTSIETPVGCRVETSAPTLTNGNTSACSLTTAGDLRVTISSLPASTNTIEVVGDVAHDAAAAGNPVLMGGYASAAAPTDVSADGDATRLWTLRSGALAVQQTYGGVLATAGNGAAGTGVQRVTIANDSTGILAAVTNVATIGTSVTPGTAAANLGKAEDAAHASGDTGVAVWTIRTDTPAASSGTTGDYEGFHSDVLGKLWTTGSYAEDSAHTSGETAVAIMGVRRDANTALAGTDGDYAPPQISALGALKVAITEGAAVSGTATAPSTEVMTVQDTRANAWSYAAASGGITNTTAVTIKTAGGGSVRNCIGSAQIVNSHATVGTEVLIRDGAAGTVLHRFYAMAAGGGWAGKLDNPICGTANTLLEVVNVTTGAAVYANFQGFTGN